MHAPRAGRKAQGGARLRRLGEARGGAASGEPGVGGVQGSVECRSVQGACGEGWLLRDRLALFEQYVPRAPEQERAPGSARGAKHAEPTIALEEHNRLLRAAVDKQTRLLTAGFTKQLQMLQVRQQGEVRMLRRKHEKEVRILAEETTKGIARELETRAELRAALRDVAILSKAYDDLRNGMRRQGSRLNSPSIP